MGYALLCKVFVLKAVILSLTQDPLIYRGVLDAPDIQVDSGSSPEWQVPRHKETQR